VRNLRRVAAVGTAVAVGAGWIALRENGYLGGVDHDGPLDAAVGNQASFACTDRPVEWSGDNLRNLGDSAITVDRIAPRGPSPQTGFLISEPQTFAVEPPDPARRANRHAQPTRRSAKGTVVPAHGISGVSYSMRYRGSGDAHPGPGSTTIGFTVRGMTVEYHVGARRFREATGIVTTTRCRIGDN
jgi:hypothetical protein